MQAVAAESDSQIEASFGRTCLAFKHPIMPSLTAALRIAVSERELESARLLLQYLEKHQLGCGHFVYVLDHAIKSGAEEIAFLMIERRVGIKNPDQTNQGTLEVSPLLSAIVHGQNAIVDALIKQGVGLDKELHKNALIRPPNDVTGHDQNPHPLALAARYNLPEIARTLLQHGVGIHERDNQNHTALYWAVEGRHAAMVELLLNAGAKVDIPDRMLRSLLNSALAFRCPDIVNLLLQHGAKVDRVFLLYRAVARRTR
jgi:hypothetical protein